MDEIVYDTKQTSIRIHRILCDKCGKYLADIKEYDDDGCVPDEDYVYEDKIRIFDQWYHIKKHLCNKCLSEYKDNVISLITGLGYSKGF